MRTQFLSLGAVLLLCATVNAEEPLLGPAIEGYGPNWRVDNRDVPVEKDTIYRTVFDAADYSDDLTSLNTRLVSVARFINMHVRNGTPLQHLDLAVVLHGAALKTVFSNEAYEAHYGLENPNLQLVEMLAEAGVKFYACGQSMAYGGVAKSELAPTVEVALSAMTMLTELQQQGYALIP